MSASDVLPLLLAAGLFLAPDLQAQSAPAGVGTRPGRAGLLNQLEALRLEHHIVVSESEAYYLVINLETMQADLKSEARLLRSAPVLAFSGNVRQELGTQQYRFARLIAPVTPEPGAEGLRLGGRQLPMDFSGRLTEGPRRRSRLYFSDGLLLQPLDAVCPDGCLCVRLGDPDIKAFGSALQPGASAILIPRSDEPQATDQ